MFEAHMTFPRDCGFMVKAIGERHGWKYSEIAGDPVLGEKNFAYLTRWEKDLEVMQIEMDVIRRAVRNYPDAGPIPLLREKIEVVIYDRRF